MGEWSEKFEFPVAVLTHLDEKQDSNEDTGDQDANVERRESSEAGGEASIGGDV